MDAGNLLHDTPEAAAGEEAVTPLLRRPGLRVERIVSMSHASPPGFWYDQPHDEWVLLVAGAARFQIDGEPERTLAPGDHLLLPAHCRHRVAWTGEHTIWLAIHFGDAVEG